MQITTDTVIEPEALSLGDIRTRYCVVCGCYTEQRVEEYVEEHFPWEKSNDTPGKYIIKHQLGWLCPVCDDFVNSISIGNY